MNAHVQLTDACSRQQDLLDLDSACQRAAGFAEEIVETERVPVLRAVGRTLAEPILAGLALPPFDQSAMDGYALAFSGDALPSGSRILVSARIAAGDFPVALPAGSGARIFTGAPLPPGAKAVLMQEYGGRDGDHLVLHRTVQRGSNIRRRGEDVEIGARLFSPGVRLDARHVALLSAQGRADVVVKRRPRVAVVSTGNELVQAGESLGAASIYDSNRPMIMALAGEAGLDVLDGGWCEDNAASLAKTLNALASSCDIVLTTGGASVGDEDHSATAVALAGGISESLRIALKPGKPAVVGQIGTAVFLGLPGNPVSALVSWLNLGHAIIAALEGRHFRRSIGAPIAAASRFERQAGRTEFAPARILRSSSGPAVEIIGRGGSARLRPLIEADGLVEIDPLHAPVEAGATVLFHSFKDGFSA